MKVDPIKELRIGTTRLNWLNYSNIVLVPKKRDCKEYYWGFQANSLLADYYVENQGTGKPDCLVTTIIALLRCLMCFCRPPLRTIYTYNTSFIRMPI